MVGLAAGLLLIFWGGSADDTALAADTEVQEDLDAYARRTEQSIHDLLCGIPGISDVRVMVTLAGGSEYVYAQNASNGGKTYVTVKDDGERAVFLRENTPQIRGIAVVCPGASDKTCRELTDLLCSLFGLSYTHVYVTG